MMTLGASLNLKEALQVNQQYSSSHVQKNLGLNGQSEHFHDDVPTCPLLKHAISLDHQVALFCVKTQGRQS
jgi:hypothetical protein